MAALSTALGITATVLPLPSVNHLYIRPTLPTRVVGKGLPLPQLKTRYYRGLFIATMARIYANKQYPKVDVPALDILTYLFENASVPDDFVLHADAANSDTNKVTKAQQRDLVQGFAHGLRHKFGVGANGPNKDVVTVVSYGMFLFPAVYFAIIAAGGVFTAASPASTVSELTRQLQMGNSTLIVCDADQKDLMLEAARRANIPPTRVLIMHSSPSWGLSSVEGSISALSDERLPWPKITDPKVLKESLVSIQWSSGTTGLPKGVMISHANLVAMCHLSTYQAKMFVMEQMKQGSYKPSGPGRTLAHLPVSHAAGIAAYVLLSVVSSQTTYWMGRYSWPNLLKYAKQHKITSLGTVPSVWQRISKSPDVTDQFDTLISAGAGAAPFDENMSHAATSKVGGNRLTVASSYGMSEATGAVSIVPKGETDTTASIGSLLPNMELRILDENYRDVEPGQAGEFVLRGPMVMNGYYQNPEATKASFHDGWLLSGDVGLERNGKLYVVDRKKDFLKYKGRQVAPAELEGILFEHPQIEEAAVIGLPDVSAGDLPRAYVVLRKGSNLTEGDVKEFLAGKVSEYKQLRGGVVFAQELPKNPSGKVLRRELRDRAKKETLAIQSKL